MSRGNWGLAAAGFAPRYLNPSAGFLARINPSLVNYFPCPFGRDFALVKSVVKKSSTLKLYQRPTLPDSVPASDWLQYRGNPGYIISKGVHNVYMRRRFLVFGSCFMTASRHLFLLKKYSLILLECLIIQINLISLRQLLSYTSPSMIPST